MTDIKPRLTRCFQAVFPKLPIDQIPTASADRLSDWDSVATVNLLNVVAEEFAVDVDWENVGELTSFQAVEKMVGERVG
jgi:acyl carrier protein